MQELRMKPATNGKEVLLKKWNESRCNKRLCDKPSIF